MINDLTKLNQARTKAWRLQCVKLAVAEVSNDFPLVRLNRSSEVEGILTAFQMVPTGLRTEVAVALATLKQFRTDRQKDLALAFWERHWPDRATALPGGEASPLLNSAPLFPRHIFAQDVLESLIRQKQNPIKRSELRRRFLTKLRQHYEPEISPVGSVEYEAIRRIGDWRIWTWFDFGGEYQFRVSFRVEHDELVEECPGRLGLSVGSLLGFGELGWDEVTPECVEEAADGAVKLCCAMRELSSDWITDVNNAVND